MVSRDKKARGWGFIYYPETPDDASIFDLIESTHMPCLLSPLHDSDVWNSTDEAKNPEHKAGTLKKPHYHGMWLFDGPARSSQAASLCEVFGDHCPPHYEAISSIPSMTRYFVHLDNPDKYQYSIDDIQAFNGATICLIKPLTPEEKSAVVKDSLAWCRDNHCTEYSDLVNYCLDKRPDWFEVVSGRTIFYSHYLSSNRYKGGRNDVLK